MSEPSTGRTEEERAAAFAELLRAEKAQNKAPFSGLAFGALLFGLVTLVIGGVLTAAACVVCAIGAIIQISQGERRGLPLVIIGLAAVVAWVIIVTIVLNRLPGFWS